MARKRMHPLPSVRKIGKQGLTAEGNNRKEEQSFGSFWLPADKAAAFCGSDGNRHRFVCGVGKERNLFRTKKRMSDRRDSGW